MLHYFQSFLPAYAPDLYMVLASFVLYLTGLMIGRWLKRRVNVGLAWVSHVFIATFSITVASRALHIDFPGAGEIGMVAAISAAFPMSAILHRFVWPLYGYPGEGARIPSFLPQVVAIIIFVFATVLGLAF